MKNASGPLFKACFSPNVANLLVLYYCNNRYNAELESAMITVKVTTVGSSTGIVLPKEALARLNVAKGDKLFLTETPDGSYRLTPYDETFARKVDLIEKIMREDKEVLRVLAK